MLFIQRGLLGTFIQLLSKGTLSNVSFLNDYQDGSFEWKLAQVYFYNFLLKDHHRTITVALN